VSRARSTIPMRILIVDDNEDSRIHLRLLMSANGYEVDTAEDGVQALEMARRQIPDIILSDVMMPEMDGFSLCREIRGDRKLRRLPFVLYTATYLDEKDEEFALALGTSLYLRKPMEADELLDNLQRVLAQPRATDTESNADPEIDRRYAEVLFRKLTSKMALLQSIEQSADSDDIDWPALIKRLRLKRGLKQTALAEAINVDQSCVSRWERGKDKPGLAAKKRLLKMLE